MKIAVKIMQLAVDLPVNTFMQIDKFLATDMKELNARVCSGVLVGEGGTGGQKTGGPGASHGGYVYYNMV
jgi:hypothetical protein